MASSVVIDYHKLPTTFHPDHVQHTTYRSDAVLGRRRVKVVQNWYRDQELGRGSFGTVFLEKTWEGECRAVKDVAKGRDGARTVKVDYRRELMAMATLAKHEDLFVQLFGWYESDHYIHIAMEYISYGNLRNYLEVERSESEARDITGQLLEGLVVMHQEGFAHRDLKPENIFVVSESPIWVKIGDFGLAKLVRDGSAFRTQAFSPGYSAPEMVINTSDSSEYTNAVDIWAVGCIAHEILTGSLPFPDFSKLHSYCSRSEFPWGPMCQKNISRKGIEIVGRMLASHPERRVTAKAALDSEWLRLDLAGAVLPEIPAPSGGQVANGNPLPSSSEQGIRNRVTITVDVNDRRNTEVLQLQELEHRLQMRGLLRKDPIDGEMPKMAKYFDMLEGLGNNDKETMIVSKQAAIDLISLANAAVPIQTTEATGVLGTTTKVLGDIKLPSVPRDEGYQFRRRSTDLLQKWDELIDPRGELQAPSTRAGISMDRQAGEGTASQYSDVSINPKPHKKVDAGVKRYLGQVLEEIHKSTSSPDKPKLRDKGAVQMLFTGGIDRDIWDSAGNTPLHIAVRRSSLLTLFSSDARLNSFHALVDSGADIEARNSLGETPLFLAVSRSSAKDTKKLLELGASVEAPNLHGIRPLMKAVQLGNKTLVELLLGQGAFVGSILVEQEPITPLHVAAQLESDAICQLILREGADVNARDFLQQTPLHKAVQGRRLSVASSLISAGADIEARDVEERTPLYYAVARNSIPLAKLLLGRGADSLVLDRSGISLREVAERANAPGMASMFDRARVTH